MSVDLSDVDKRRECAAYLRAIVNAQPKQGPGQVTPYQVKNLEECAQWLDRGFPEASKVHPNLQFKAFEPLDFVCIEEKTGGETMRVGIVDHYLPRERGGPGHYVIVPAWGTIFTPSILIPAAQHEIAKLKETLMKR